MFQLTWFSHNTLFFRNQNARYAGTRCTPFRCEDEAGLWGTQQILIWLVRQVTKITLVTNKQTCLESNKKRSFSVHCGVEDRKSSLENRWAISMIQLCCAHRRKDHDLGNDRVLAWKVAINHHSELNNSCCFLELKLRNQQSPIFQIIVMKCFISVIWVNTDRNFVDNFLQVVIYLVLVANI